MWLMHAEVVPAEFGCGCASYYHGAVWIGNVSGENRCPELAPDDCWQHQTNRRDKNCQAFTLSVFGHSLLPGTVSSYLSIFRVVFCTELGVGDCHFPTFVLTPSGRSSLSQTAKILRIYPVQRTIWGDRLGFKFGANGFGTRRFMLDSEVSKLSRSGIVGCNCKSVTC